MPELPEGRSAATREQGQGETGRTRGVPLGRIVAFLDRYLDIEATPDYPGALNGLQVEADGPVRTVAVAVDASRRVIEAAAPAADLLIVHHGIFWDGLQPLRGPHFRRVRRLIETQTALYSAHLPLDGHAEVGNAIAIARALQLQDPHPFGSYDGATVGWRGRLADPRTPRQIQTRLVRILNGPVKILAGGPDEVASVGVATGAGASLLAKAAELGLDLLVTGEANHHHAIEAAERGVTLLLGGHYATEVFGVKALMGLLTDRFDIEGHFVDAPTGL